MLKREKQRKIHKHRIEINWAALDAMLQFKVTQVFVCDYFGISADTLQRRIVEEKGMTYTEYHKMKLEKTAVALQEKALSMALQGHPTLLIFALKNMAGWADKMETVGETGRTITLNYKLPEGINGKENAIEAEYRETNDAGNQETI